MTDPADASASSATTPATGSGRGCLKGCLGGCGGCLTLLLVIGVIGYFVTDSYVDENLPRWRTEHPLLTTAFDFIATDELESVDTLMRTGRVDGDENPDKLPSWVVRHPAPLTESVRVSDTQVTVFQTIDESRPAVRRRMRKSLRRGGWKRTTHGRGRPETWQRQRWTCQLDVVGGFENETEVWLRCDQAPAPPK